MTECIVRLLRQSSKVIISSHMSHEVCLLMSPLWVILKTLCAFNSITMNWPEQERFMVVHKQCGRWWSGFLQRKNFFSKKISSCWCGLYWQVPTVMTVGDFRICCSLKRGLKVYNGGSGELFVFVTFLIETSLQGLSSGVMLLRTRNRSRLVILRVRRRSCHAVQCSCASKRQEDPAGRKHRARYPQTLNIRS